MRTFITNTWKRLARLVPMLLALLLVAWGEARAQSQIQVSGKVTDAAGEPVIGAAVVETGTTNGTVTDIDGNYHLRVSPTGSITCQFIGYETSTVPVNGQTTVDIQMADEFSELEEVQVVAYGAQKKVTVTGAISSVKAEDLVRTPVSSVTNVLAGQLSGVSTVQYSGEPGSDAANIFVRGKATFSGDGVNPLIQVDGVERDMWDIDPNEIESITVLKDASATAVFGVRGANGVILVTTKRGKEGKANINVSANFSAITPTKMVEMTSSAEYARFYNKMLENDGNAPIFSDALIDKFENPKSEMDRLRFPSYDWADYVMKKFTLQTQTNVSVDGGNDKVKYFVSVGFFTQGGVFEQFDLDYDVDFRYKRLNYRSNIDIDVTKFTKLSINVAGQSDRKQKSHISGDSSQIIRNIYWSAPFASSGYHNGAFIFPSTSTADNPDGIMLPANVMADTSTPYAYITNGGGYFRYENNKIQMDLIFDQKLDMLTEGLSFKMKGSYNSYYNISKDVTGATVAQYTVVQGKVYEKDANGNILKDEAGNLIQSVDANGDPLYEMKLRKTGEKKSVSSFGTPSAGVGRDWYFETSLNYSRSFGANTISALLLYNQSKAYYPGTYSGIPRTYIGLVGRISYDWKNRYMAEFNFGRNGSENFAPNKRYGSFPAASVGWAVSEEDFMQNITNIVSFLKLRASWGLVGNDKIGGSRFMYVADPYVVNNGGAIGETTSAGNQPYSSGYPFGAYTTYVSGFAMGLGAAATNWQLNNADATWETSFKQDYGLDVNFINNKLSCTFDYYYEKREDILSQDATAPSMLGFNQPYKNFGRVNSWGWEASVGWNSTIGDDLRVWAKYNMSYNQNEIIENRQTPQQEEYMYTKGRRIGAHSQLKFWRFSEDGMGPKDNAAYAAAFGGKFETAKNGVPAQTMAVDKIHPGDALYVDLNGDGKVDDNDFSHDFGHTDDPEYIAGLNLGASWKGWSVSMQWSGSWNVTRVISNVFRRPFTSQQGTTGGGLLKYHIDNTWDPEKGGQDYDYPRATFINSNQNYDLSSTLYEKDSKYLRLKTAEISYNFDFPFMKTIGMKRLVLAVNGYNLLTFTPYKWGDPEARASNAPSYPLQRTYTASLKVAF